MTKGLSITRVDGTYTQGVTRVATHEETVLGLQGKLIEECGELIKAPRDVTEYADVLQVLKDFDTINGVRWSEVEAALGIKKLNRGGFLGPVGRALLWSPECPPTEPQKGGE